MSLDLDLTEIYEVFFEESTEGLEMMESSLLGLDLGSADLDTINDIFRAAHSIKGGAGTFGFLDIASFTHGVETLLDQMRDGKRDVSEDVVQLLLESVDHIGAMIQHLKEGKTDESNRRAELDKRIETLLAGCCDKPSATSTGEIAAIDEPGQIKTRESADDHSAVLVDKPSVLTTSWTVNFKPNRNILLTGNDPLYILRDLESKGTLEVTPDDSALPDFDALDPEELHISWTLKLASVDHSSAIKDAFEWVAEDCDLDVNLENTLSDINQQTDTDGARAGASQTTRLSNADTVNPASEKAQVATAVPTASKKAKKAQSSESSSIRVGIDKVDSLLNLVGELVITQSMLRRFGESYNEDALEELRDGLNQLERHTRELQESAMQIRMLPIISSFSRFPRLVRDMSQSLGKKIQLVMSGEHTEVDKTVLEKLSDPLVHLVRNSLDHGIETPEIRLKNGKPETGTLHLSAAHEGGNVVIQVEDDGAGLNRERIIQKAIEKNLISSAENLSDDRIDNLIFHPGFSTAENVTDVSGRGVGMDVVRRNILDLGGRIRVRSKPGTGTNLRISLPLTLAILDGQLVRIGSEIYVISLLSIVETVQVQPDHVKTVSKNNKVYRMRDRYIPVVRAEDQFGITPDPERSADLLVIVETESQRFGILVHELLEQQQIVIKSIEKNYKKVSGLTGATILGDGRVALILDIPGLAQDLMHGSQPGESSEAMAA